MAYGRHLDDDDDTDFIGCHWLKDPHPLIRVIVSQTHSLSFAISFLSFHARCFKSETTRRLHTRIKTKTMRSSGCGVGRKRRRRTTGQGATAVTAALPVQCRRESRQRSTTTTMGAMTVMVVAAAATFAVCQLVGHNIGFAAAEGNIGESDLCKLLPR